MRKDSINFSSPLCDDVAIRLFEHIPGNNILVYADPPNYTVAAVSADYLEIAVKNKSDLVGKGIFDSFPSNRNNPDDNGESKLRASFQEVIEHKRKAISTHRYDILNLKGEFEEKYWKVFNIPFNDENGDIKFIIHNVEDITYEIKWKQQENFIKEVQVRNSLFMQAPVAIQILRGENLVVEFANDLTLDIWRKGRDVIGKPLSEIMPELIGQGIIDKIKQVYYTGIPYEAYEVAIYVDKEGQRENFYFNFVYQPFYESDNKNPSGISIFASDVTDRVNAKNELKKKEQDLRESELRFRKLADESPIFVFISIGDEFASIIYWNKTWLDYTGQTMEEALGRAWSGIIHPEDIPLVYQYYNPAYNKREEYFVPAVRVKKFDGSYRWHSFKGNPRYSDGVFNGYVGVGFDIHEQKLYEKTIKRSEQDLKEKIEERTAELISQKLLLDNILANSSNGISVTEMVRDQNGNVIDAMTIIANESAVKLIGLPREIYLSKSARDVDPNILESPYGKLCLKTLKEGEPGIIQYYLEHTGKWLELTISKMDDEHLIHIFTDVTPIKESQ
ncbi:MAG: PAS domain-containing protein, partial [Flavitalea sp.]